MSDEETQSRVVVVRNPSIPIFDTRYRGGNSWTAKLTKAEGPGRGAASRQQVTLGLKPHPFDMRACRDFKNQNVHHSTCLETKRASHVGLGFKDKKVGKTLNSLCQRSSFQDVLNDVSDDYWSIANGYMEVVRDDKDDEIVGLHHMPGTDVRLVVENDNYDMHYEVQSRESGPARVFALFGDLEDFKARQNKDTSKGTKRGPGRPRSPEVTKGDRIGELITFRRSSNLSRWYGFPDWLSGVAAIEIVQCLHQHTFDFFLNRGVPEFMLFVLGKKLQTDEWTTIENAMKKNIGMGNSHKSMAVNIADGEVTVQLERLAMEGKTDGLFGEMSDVLAMHIVSSHRTPPLLAGIQIPGKLGATNELPNALMAFQALVIGQAQNDFTTVFDSSLGNPELNGGLQLKEGDFEFNTILDKIDLGVADTVGRMRETVPEAKASGRDLQAGLKKAALEAGIDTSLVDEWLDKAAASFLGREVA